MKSRFWMLLAIVAVAACEDPSHQLSGPSASPEAAVAAVAPVAPSMTVTGFMVLYLHGPDFMEGGFCNVPYTVDIIDGFYHGDPTYEWYYSADGGPWQYFGSTDRAWLAMNDEWDYVHVKAVVTAIDAMATETKLTDLRYEPGDCD